MVYVCFVLLVFFLLVISAGWLLVISEMCECVYCIYAWVIFCVYFYGDFVHRTSILQPLQLNDHARNSCICLIVLFHSFAADIYISIFYRFETTQTISYQKSKNKNTTKHYVASIVIGGACFVRYSMGISSVRVYAIPCFFITRSVLIWCIYISIKLFVGIDSTSVCNIYAHVARKVGINGTI